MRLVGNTGEICNRNKKEAFSKVDEAGITTNIKKPRRTLEYTKC